MIVHGNYTCQQLKLVRFIVKLPFGDLTRQKHTNKTRKTLSIMATTYTDQGVNMGSDHTFPVTLRCFTCNDAPSLHLLLQTQSTSRFLRPFAVFIDCDNYVS